MQPALRAMAEKREGMTPEELLSLMGPAHCAMTEKREGMTVDVLLSLMGPAHSAMAEKREANCDFYMCTIYNKALCIVKRITDFHRHLGIDSNATVKAVTTDYSNYQLQSMVIIHTLVMSIVR